MPYTPEPVGVDGAAGPLIIFPLPSNVTLPAAIQIATSFEVFNTLSGISR